MKNYSDYSVEDFINDEYFLQWVKFPTSENKLFWEQWLKEHPKKSQEIEQSRLIILTIDFKKTPENEIPKEVILKNIFTSIYKEQSVVIPSVSYGQSASKAIPYYRIAASLLILMLATLATYFYLDNTKEFSTAYGQIQNIELPDGSTVVLNANSTLSFEDNWADRGTREVWLEGEAYFKITHTKNHQKFLVHTDHLKVEVLGTEFNVTTREENTQVVLNSGKVKLQTNAVADEDIYMSPGDLVEFTEKDQKLTKEKVNAEEFSSWRKHQLIFKATRLDEVAKTLEEYYGWKVSFEDEKIKSYEFTGTISTENIDVLLFTISEAFNIEISKNSSELIFKSKE